MYRDDLVEYLSGRKTYKELNENILEELKLFQSSLKVKGGSAYIKFDGDNQKTFISSEHIKRLCLDYLNKNIDDFFLSYIADALLLSENTVYENEDIREKLELFTDFEINGNLSKEIVKDIYYSLH
jgi:hypothetical protein